MPEWSPQTWLIVASLIGAVAVPVVLWHRDVLRPGSFQRAGLRDVRGVPGLAWLMCGFGLYIVQFAGLAGGMHLAERLGLSTPDQIADGEASLGGQAVVALVMYGVTLAAAALLMYLLVARAGRGSGIAWRWPDPLLGAGLLLMAAPVYIAVSWSAQAAAQLMSPEPLDPIAHDTLRLMLEEKGSPWFWAMTAAVVIGAPAAEEIVFRLFLQSAILRWTGSAWAAIGATSILFGAVHLGSVPWYAAGVLAVFGVVLGIAFERTKRIGVPIVMHALFNAIQVAAALAGLHEPVAPPAS